MKFNFLQIEAIRPDATVNKTESSVRKGSQEELIQILADQTTDVDSVVQSPSLHEQHTNEIKTIFPAWDIYNKL